MKIGNTNIHADSFVKKASAVLETHYHRDHLAGVRRYTGSGPLLCSPLTARLLTRVECSDTGPLDSAQYDVVIAIGVIVSLNNCSPSVRFRCFIFFNCRKMWGRNETKEKTPAIQNALTENMFQKET